jgi:hypothetical protein
VPGDEGALRCDWQDSSMLTVARTFPRVGGRLLQHCIREWPLRLLEQQAEGVAETPKISVVLPVGGKDRIPLFHTVVKAFFGQTVAEIEIIAVEQAISPDFEVHCPPGVRYLFVHREEGRQFNKSLAMNAGVRSAKAPVVLLHDADLLPPARYVESILEKLENGWEAVRPVRFAFYLDQRATKDLLADNGKVLPQVVADAQANNPGLSTAVTKEVYWQIGGHDERFEGWGGEDWEFLDRLQTVRLMKGSYCPAIHLWHLSAPKKVDGDRNNPLVEKLCVISRKQRILDLRSKNAGDRFA